MSSLTPGSDRHEVAAAQTSEFPNPRKSPTKHLTDYDKGYLDGLLEASRHAGPKKRLEVYKADAEHYLASIGHEDWRVDVRRISERP